MIQLKECLNRVGIAINDRQIMLFKTYLDAIMLWNKRTNLVSRQDEQRLVERHVLESVAVLTALEIPQRSKIIDIGSGAGFPAIPVYIIRPDLNFLLVESKRLKTLFLKELVSQLKFDRVEVVCERAEQLQSAPGYNKKFDIAFSRAVASLDVVYEWIATLIKPGGTMIFWKGGDIEQEIKKLLLANPNLKLEIKKMDSRLVKHERDKKFVQIQIMKTEIEEET